jgi:hypothetical protein
MGSGESSVDRGVVLRRVMGLAVLVLVALGLSAPAAQSVRASEAGAGGAAPRSEPGALARGAFAGAARAAQAPNSDRLKAAAQARERAARRQLIEAGHIPPPGRMTREEIQVYLDAYQREHNIHFGYRQWAGIAGRLEYGHIEATKPADMREPEWIRRSGIALNVLSLIPAGRMASVAKGLASRLAVVAAGGLPELRAEAQQAVARAVAMIGPGSGAVYGTRVHYALHLQIRGSPNLRGEVSFLNRREVRSGTKGSVRLDIVAYSEGRPAAIFDLKTGNAKLTATRIVQIQQHIPRDWQVPIEELRVG